MFSRHKLYTVHLHPDAPEPYETIKLVPESFSFPGFIFNGLWLMYHRAWLLGIAFFGVIVLLNACGMWFPEHIASFMIVRSLVSVYVGLQGYDMVRASLKRQGYLMVDIVAADSLIEAQQRFLDRRLPHMYTHAMTAGAGAGMMPARA